MKTQTYLSKNFNDMQWTSVNVESIVKDKTYIVRDAQGFIYNARYDGKSWVSTVYGEIMPLTASNGFIFIMTK